MTTVQRLSLSLLALLLLLGTCVRAQNAPTLDAADRAYLDSLLDAKFPADGPGGTLLVAKDGLPVYERSFGLASMELRVPNHPGNVYKIGSISKQFAAVAALQLAEAGKLDLQADIRTYLPEFGGDAPIPVARLMDHTSGIPSKSQLPAQPAWDDLTVSADNFVRYLGQQHLMFKPGDHWSYTNNAFGLLGIIVERVSGQSLSDYYQEHIFTPLGMRHTYTSARRSVSPGRATGYSLIEADRFEPVVEVPYADYLIGAGFISSTVGDMLRWHEGLLAGKAISKEMLEKAWTPGKLNDGRANQYNTGWALNTVQDIKLLYHGGALPGFLAGALAAPEQGVYAVCLVNSGTVSPSFIVEEAARLAVDIELPQHDSLRLTTEALEAYTGAYPVYAIGLRKTNTPGALPMTRYVRVRNDSLFYQIDDGPLVPLINVGKDRFTPPGSRGEFRFERAADGTVTALNLRRSPLLTYGIIPREVKSARPLPPLPTAVTLPREQLGAMVGTYQTSFGTGSNIIIRLEGDQLIVGAPFEFSPLVPYEALSKERIRPVSGSGLGVVKVNWEGDRVVSVSELHGGREFVAKRIK